MFHIPVALVVGVVFVSSLQTPPKAPAAPATVRVTGLVLDSTDQPLYGAAVTMRAEDGTEHKTTSSRSGRYEARLMPGTYAVRVEYTFDPTGLWRFEQPAVRGLVVDVKGAGPVEAAATKLPINQALFAMERDARAALTRGDRAKAAEAYQKLLAAAPHVTDVHLLLARCYAEQFDPARKGDADNDAMLTKAVEHARRAADTGRDSATKVNALTQVAKLYEDPKGLNDPLSAEDAVRMLVGAEPARADHQFWMARLQEQQGKLADAESTLRSAAEQPEAAAKAKQELANFYGRTKQADKLRALTGAPAPAGGGLTQSRVTALPGAVRAGGNIPMPQKIHDVKPTYSPEALRARVVGVVIVELQIDQQGNVADAAILRSIPLLDAAALDAVKQWRFTVTEINGMPVPVIMTATVNFTLQ
jgi:protein TonB